MKLLKSWLYNRSNKKAASISEEITKKTNKKSKSEIIYQFLAKKNAIQKYLKLEGLKSLPFNEVIAMDIVQESYENVFKFLEQDEFNIVFQTYQTRLELLIHKNREKYNDICRRSDTNGLFKFWETLGELALVQSTAQILCILAKECESINEEELKLLDEL